MRQGFCVFLFGLYRCPAFCFRISVLPVQALSKIIIEADRLTGCQVVCTITKHM